MSKYLSIAALLFVVAGCNSGTTNRTDLLAQYKAEYSRYYDACIAPAFGGAAAALSGAPSKGMSAGPAAQRRTQCASKLDELAKLQKQIVASAGN